MLLTRCVLTEHHVVDAWYSTNISTESWMGTFDAIVVTTMPRSRHVMHVVLIGYL